MASIPPELEKACIDNDISRVQILLGDCQHDPETIAAVLHFACVIGSVKVVSFLVQEYDNENELENLLSATDTDNYTALHIASQFGNVECVKVLVEEGKDDPQRVVTIKKKQR